jgi:hypothetical protein
MRRIVLLLIALACAREAFAHGGTAHSADMSVDNDLELAPGLVKIAQLHRCRNKVAEDIWRATDRDGDGQLSDAEWKQGVEDSKSVYQQWNKLEVDWKLAVPRELVVELASFPRTRPATFGGVEIAIAHRATYEARGDAPVRTIGFHCTSLNARSIQTKVRATGGVKIEQASAGTLAADGTSVAGVEQVDGAPDALSFVVREPGGPAGHLTARSPVPAAQTRGEVALGVALIALGFWWIVGRAVALGRGDGYATSLAGIAAGFVALGLGVYAVGRALVLAGMISINP